MTSCTLEDRALTIRRDVWGFLLGLVATLALYGAYAWIAVTAVAGAITLGAMTMYLMLFRQGQSAVSAVLSAVGGMYEDNLYLSTLYDYLETPVVMPHGRQAFRAPAPVTACVSKMSVSATQARRGRRCATCRCISSRDEVLRWWAKMVPARPR